MKRFVDISEGTEERRNNFIRLAEARTNKILRMIRLLSNLSNRGAYDYKAQDIKKIFQTIDRELRQARARFDGDSQDEFSLRD